MSSKLEDRNWLKNEVAKWPLRLIAKELGVPYSRVYKAVKDFGIEVPKRQGYIYTEETRQAKSDSQKAAYKKKYPIGRFGELHPRWKGGRQKVGDYVAIHQPGHPRATNSNRVFEHILVAEKTLGRYLLPNEVVHHINGDKLDNRSDNLLVVTRGDHVNYHLTSGIGIQAYRKRIEYLEGLLKDANIPYD